MFRVTVEQHFSGAHRIRSYRGSCERLHGHNWIVRVRIEGEKLNKEGLLVDFRLLKKELSRVLKKLDHNYLNTIAYFKRHEPSAEHIAYFIFTALNKRISKKNNRVHSVVVKESDDCWAEYLNDREQGIGDRV